MIGITLPPALQLISSCFNRDKDIEGCLPRDTRSLTNGRTALKMDPIDLPKR